VRVLSSSLVVIGPAIWEGWMWWEGGQKFGVQVPLVRGPEAWLALGCLVAA